MSWFKLGLAQIQVQNSAYLVFITRIPNSHALGPTLDLSARCTSETSECQPLENQRLRKDFYTIWKKNLRKKLSG